jgi:DNA-directed RNA polymerase subunit RPC12/RpoP
MQTEDMRLDGNAAGGALRELFTIDMTAAMATCSSCGTARAVGALLEYGHEMGLILRCPHCNMPVLRMVRTPKFLRVDVTGLSFIAIDEPVS